MKDKYTAVGLIICFSLCCQVLTQTDYDPDCVRFNLYDECIECIIGKIAVKNKCLDIIPHCLEFNKDYECTLCETGYKKTENNTCLLKSISSIDLGVSFYEMSGQERLLDLFFQIIQDALQESTTNIPEGSYLDKVYKFTDGVVNIYRLLYRGPNGYTQTTVQITKSDRKIQAETKIGITKAFNENVIDFSKDANRSTILAYIKDNHPTLKESDLLMAFFRQSQGVFSYRLQFYEN